MRLSEGKTQLEVIEKRSQDYEKKKRTLHIREMLFCYQDLQMLENEEKEVESQRTVLEEQLKDLEKRQCELEQSQKAAQERLRIAENSTVFQDMKETMDSLQRQIDAASVESRVWERRLKELETLEEKIKELSILLRKDLPVDEEEKKALSQLSGTGMDTEAKISVFKKYGEKVDQQDALYEQNKIHLQDQIRAREKVMAELTDKIKKLEANCLVFPPEIERAQKADLPGAEKSGHRHGSLHFCGARPGNIGSGVAKSRGDLSGTQAFLSYYRWEILRQGHESSEGEKTLFRQPGTHGQAS